MTINIKVITQVDQGLAITYVYGGCHCIKWGCHLRGPVLCKLQLIELPWSLPAGLNCG